MKLMTRVIVFIMGIAVFTSGCNRAPTPEIGFTQPVFTEPSKTTPQPHETQPVLNCTSPAPLTISMTEGPYYKSNSPERTSLIEPGLTGTKLTDRKSVV